MTIDEIPKDLRIFPTFWQDKLDTILTEDIIKNNHKEIELNKILVLVSCKSLVNPPNAISAANAFSTFKQIDIIKSI